MLDWLMENLGLIIVIAIIAAICANFIFPLLPWFTNRQRTYIEKATDAHEAVYRKRKKAGRLNIRGQKKKVLYLGGDKYHHPTKIGKVVGSIQDVPVTDLFVKSSVFGKARWLCVPTALLDGYLNRAYYIDAVGIVPVGNFYHPVWPTGSDNWKLQLEILRHEEYVMANEKAVELEECRVHAISDSVQMSTQDRRIVQRTDSPPLQPVNEGEPRREAEIDG